MGPSQDVVQVTGGIKVIGVSCSAISLARVSGLLQLISERLFPEELDRDDPWQFKNIRVT